jgi:ATP-binding cassette subfamily B protein
VYFDWRLWRMTEGLRGRILACVALGLLALAIGILRYVFVGLFLGGVFQRAGFTTLLPLLLGAAAAILLRAALDHARTNVAHATSARVQSVLRARLFDRIVALGPAWFAGERTGGVMLSMIDGVEQLQTFFGQYLPQVCIAACAPVAIFLFIAWWDVPVACVLLGAALFTLVLPAAVHRSDRRASLERGRAFKLFGEEFLDAVQGLPTLKAFGQSAAYGRRLADKARALSESTMWVLGLSILTRGVTDFGTAFGAAAALILGAWRVSEGQMSLAALLIVLMAGTEIFRPLRDLRSVLHQGMVGQSAAAGVHALLEQAISMPAGSYAKVPVLSPAIEFDRVAFAYPGGRGAAHDGLDFRVAAGERIGIVGPSGAGKSSIVRLLLRQHDPQSGAIRIGGHDLRQLDPEQVRSLIAVVAQDTYLFHGTIEENLRLGRPDATHAQVEAAARAANLHEFVLGLPDGYATMIGERGVRLSGGQRQRLAIARALLRDAPILILDEALSAVDAENEAAIQQALDRLMQGRTTLILAHRLSSVIAADRILVLGSGHVVQSGSHADMIVADGPYRDLMGGQAQDAGAEVISAILPTVATTVPAQDTPRVDVRPLDQDAAEIGWGVTLSTLLGFIRPWGGQLAATVLFGIGRVAAFVGVGVLGAWIIADLAAGRDYSLPAIALLIVAPLAGLLHWLESWLAHHMAYRLLAEMRIELFAKLDALAPSYLLRRRSGDLVALATQDIETVEYFFAHTVAPAVVCVLVPISVLAVLGWFAWPLALVLLPFLGFAALSPVMGRQRIDRMASQARGALGLLSAHITETIQGLSDLIAFQATAVRRDGFLARVREYQDLRLKLQADLSRQNALLEVATGLGSLAVAATGAMLVTQGAIGVGFLPLAILISVAAFLPVSEIAQVGRQLADTIASTRRLHVVHSESVRITDGPQAPLPVQGGSAIRFDNVTFAYEPGQVPALDHVRFAIEPGTTVALVGASGAGKTTIANLLLRFWDPDTGSVGIDGVDLRQWSLDALRGRIALVAQDTYLFNDTLEANIRIANPAASAGDMDRAIQRAALADFVAGLPEALETRVGERGVQLSGGQRQRIAIARAFLKDAPILVLDEATSHLDAISEGQIRHSLEALMQDRTTIVIAHRLSTIRAANLILVLANGQVIEAGTHSNLLARRGPYARLVGSQVAGGRK